MPPKSRKRKAAACRLEDDTEESQEQIPSSNRRNLRKYSASTMSMKRQETLTQIGWISSPHTGLENDELSYDPGPSESAGQPTGSKPGKKRRKTVQKETLTQMDFLSPVTGERENTSYDQENVDFPPVLATSRRKRPKAVKEDTLAREVYTRRVGRRAAERSLAAIADNNSRAEPPALKATGGQYHEVSGPTTLPPRTPRAPRSRVIQSSQSPPDTPLSTQSRRSLGTQTRSPLKEMSVNVRTANTPTMNRLLFPSKLEIADTTDSGDEDSQTSTAIATSNNVSQIYLPPAMRILAKPDLDDLNNEVRARSSAITSVVGHSVANTDIKREILDSEDEEMENVLFEDESGARAATQAADNGSTSSSPSQLKQETQFLPETVSNPLEVGEDSDREAKIASINGDHRFEVANEPAMPDFEAPISGLRTPNGPLRGTKFSIRGDVHALEKMRPIASPIEDPQSRNSRAASELSIPDFDAPNLQNRTPTGLSSSRSGAATTPKHPASHRFNTDILLAADPILNRGPSPTRPGPETESQFENAWRSLSPPPHLSPFSSSPNHVSPNDPATPTLVNPFVAPQHSPHAAAVPPSQATTVDITQCTQPQLPLPRDFPAGIIDLSSVRDGKHQPSSSPLPPPSLPPLSSSPVYARKTQGEDAWMGYAGARNGRRLTDSQLLPDSLMNDTYAGPPGWETPWSDEMEYE